MKDVESVKVEVKNYRKSQEDLGMERCRKSEILFDNLKSDILTAQESIKTVNDERKNSSEE